jgi:hypothetical protein
MLWSRDSLFTFFHHLRTLAQRMTKSSKLKHEAPFLHLLIHLLLFFPFSSVILWVIEIARPGHNSTRKISNTEGHKNIKTDASSRHLTINFSKLDLLNQIEQARQTRSLNKKIFLQLYAKQLEHLFNSLYNHILKLEKQLKKTTKQNLNNNLKKENQQLKKRVKN